MDPNLKYINLLKQVITGQFARENGLRVKYLIDCFDTSQPYDLAKVIDVRTDSINVLYGIKADADEQEFYKERLLGFPYSMLGHARMDNIEDLIRQVLAENIPGHFLEAGVWRGGACIFARLLLDLLAPDQDRLVYAADSFAGLPLSDHEADQPYPFHLDSLLACPLDQVRAHFEHFDIDPDKKTRFVKGMFADSLPGLQTDGLAILRADGDLYVSTRDILDNLYEQVVPGGFVIIDDFGALEPCRRATEDFRTLHGITDPMHKIDWTGVYWRKTN